MDKPIDRKISSHFVQFENRKVPKFLEVKDQEWITYGENNDYPYYLETLYMRSSIHNAIINSKVRYIVGGGLGYDPMGIHSIEQKALANKILQQPFADVDLNGTYNRIALDYMKFGAYAVLVQWGKSKRGATLKYIDVKNIRTNADRSKFYYTSKWWIQDAKGNRKKNPKPTEAEDFQTFAAYDPKNRKGNQVYYYTPYAPESYIYGVPDYIGAVTWIENDIRYTDFQFKNISASFSPAKIVNVIGELPTPEQQEEMVDGIKKNFIGENGERLVVNFAPSKELGMFAEDSLVSDQSTLYKEIVDQAVLHITASHHYPKLLLGYTEAGALGQRNEAEMYVNAFQRAYVDPIQKTFEDTFNTFASDFGVGIKLISKKFNPFGVDTVVDEKAQKMLNALNALPDAVLPKVVESLSAEELRSLVGLKGAKTTTTQTLSKFASAKMDIFAQFGRDAGLFEVITERDCPSTDPSEIEKFEKDFERIEFADIKVKSIDRSVLDLLSKDKYAPVDVIAKAVKVTPSEVRDAIGRLIDNGYISSGTEDIQGVKTQVNEVTKAGNDVISEQPAKTDKYEVVYKYDVAAGMGEPILPKDENGNERTRKFCRDLIGLNRVYTRDEINQISAKEDRNVWTLRGGWYNNDGVNQPQCRHTWKQQLVKIK